METITIPKVRYDRMKKEIIVLRSSRLYRRLLEFEENISKDKKYSRKDLGFKPNNLFFILSMIDCCFFFEVFITYSKAYISLVLVSCLKNNLRGSLFTLIS